MKRTRKHISLAEQLAAALACLLPQAQRDQLRVAKVPAKAVRALFEMDHVVLHAHGGPDTWENLDPKLKAPHREKSRRDTSIVAKTKRLERQFRPEVVGVMMALVDVIDRQMPRQRDRKAAGAFSGAAGAKPRSKRKIAQRRSPWPPKGSRTFKATRGMATKEADRSKEMRRCQ